jgi:hypothetical protein
MVEKYSGFRDISLSLVVFGQALARAKGYVKPASGAACHNVLLVFSVLLG